MAAVKKRNVLIVGDSNMSAIMENHALHGFESIKAPGCTFVQDWKSQWRQRIKGLMMTRLRQPPEVNNIYIDEYKLYLFYSA